MKAPLTRRRVWAVLLLNSYVVNFNSPTIKKMLQIKPTPQVKTPPRKVLLRSTEMPPFPDAKFDILYADPPWDYKGQLQHNGTGGRDTGGAIRHYPTVTTTEMATWQVGKKLAKDDALLFMWATSPHLDQAIELGKAWGFNWATVAFVWDKTKVNPGFYTMSQYELCLVFKRGKIPSDRGSRSVRQSVVVERGCHSEKPDEVRKRIGEMFPNHQKLEMFARKKVKGWQAWGLEA